MLTKLIIGYLAALSLLALPIAIAQPVPKVLYEINVLELRDFSCRVLERDCSALPLPLIEFDAIYEMGALGYTYPDKIVLDSSLLPYLDKTYFESIVAHELTHFVDLQIGAVTWGVGCGTEWNGWRVGNAWLVSHGRADLADFTWNLRYNCYTGVTYGISE